MILILIFIRSYHGNDLAGESGGIKRDGGRDASEDGVAFGAAASWWIAATNVYDVDVWLAGPHLFYYDGRLLLQNASHVLLEHVDQLCSN